MEGQGFCGVTDENEGEVVLVSLAKLIFVTVLFFLQFVPIVPFKLQKLSGAMYLEDTEEATTKFCELLGYPPPEMVRLKIW